MGFPEFVAILCSLILFIIIKIAKLTNIKIFWPDDVINATNPCLLALGSPKKKNQWSVCSYIRKKSVRRIGLRLYGG